MGLPHVIYICTVYIKPRISSVSEEHDILFEDLRDPINKFSQNGKVILMGDFNARTADLKDNTNIGNNYLPDDYTSDLSILPRQNMELITNEQGKSLIELCIESKLRIPNGW